VARLGFRRLLLRGTDGRSRCRLHCLGACGSGSLRTCRRCSAKPKLPRERRAALRISRRYHRLSWRQPLFGSVRLRREAKSHQIALQYLQLRAVFQADQIIALDRPVDRYGGLPWFLGYLARTSPRQCAVDAPDDARQCGLVRQNFWWRAPRRFSPSEPAAPSYLVHLVRRNCPGFAGQISRRAGPRSG